MNYIGGLLASLFFFYFLVRALQTRRPVDFLLSGFGVGLCLSLYLAARLTLVVAAIYLLQRALLERGFLREQRRGLLVLALGAVVFLAPQAVTYAENSDPLVFFFRTSQVFVLRPDVLAHEEDVYHVHTIPAVLWNQILRTVGAFNYRGDTSEQYDQQGPLLDFWTSALFVLGVAVVGARLRQPRYFVLTSWLWLTLLFGSVLSLNALFSPHIVSAMGIICLFPALILDTGWRGMVALFGARGNRMYLALVALFVLLVARANYVDYFYIHATTMEQPGFFTVLGDYVQTVNSRYQVYFLSDRDTSLRYQVMCLLVPNIDGVDVRNQALPLPLTRVPADKGVDFIVTVNQDTPGRLAALKAAYPTGAETMHRSSRGLLLFYSDLVDNPELLQASPGAAIDHAPIPGVLLDQLDKGNLQKPGCGL